MAEDNEYQKATKIVVDDAMRTDQLGPSVVRVLEDHKPANDKIQNIILEGIKNNSAVQTALSTFITNNATMKRGKVMDRVVTITLTTGLTIIIGFLAKLAHLI